MKISKIILLFISASLSIFAYTQDYPHDYVKYPFLNIRENVLLFEGDSSPFETIFNKLEKILFDGEGNLDILHIGGSHIQAGVFSGVMRKQFQTMMPDINSYRGFIFPYKVARTNNPSNYHINYWGTWESCRNVQKRRNCTLGLSGMSVTTYSESSAIKITFDEDYQEYNFSRVKVYCTLDTNTFDIIPSDSVIQKTFHPEAGYIEFELYGSSNEIKFTLQKKNSNQSYFTLYGLEFENSMPGIAYHSVGVNGADVPSYNACTLLDEHIRSVSPDLIIFSIGINDAYTTHFSASTFKANYGNLISRIKEVLPDVQIIFTTNNDSYYRGRYANKNGVKVREAMMEMGKKYDAAVWDMFSVMGGLNSIVTWEEYGLAKRDKIHFTRAGYTLVSNLFFSAFIHSFENYLTRSVNN